MKIKNTTDELNTQALINPQPGDYWEEHFCPYFLIVDIKGDDIYVLSALGGPQSFNRKHEIYAKKEVDGSHWTFDPSKAMIVDKAWVTKAVTYESIDGFVAMVHRRIDLIKDWQEYYAESPYEVPRLSDLIPKPIPKLTGSMKPEYVELARKAGFDYDRKDCNFYPDEGVDHINAKLVKLIESVIAECAVIATDASRLRLPASQYADLITKFEDLKKE